MSAHEAEHGSHLILTTKQEVNSVNPNCGTTSKKYVFVIILEPKLI